MIIIDELINQKLATYYNGNKKTETKNQSFKEKYKPKTSWQLEELRRYGL